MLSRSIDHRYADDVTGAQYIGVTSCLRVLQDSSWWTDEGRIKGSHAHEAIALDQLGFGLSHRPGPSPQFSDHVEAMIAAGAITVSQWHRFSSCRTLPWKSSPLR